MRALPDVTSDSIADLHAHNAVVIDQKFNVNTERR